MKWPTLDELWYGQHPLRWLLYPISSVYRVGSIIRREYLQRVRQQHFPVPIIVVGNLSVGGVGKTPLVIAIASRLQSRGLRVGIVSRGYGAETLSFPHEVRDGDDAQQVGDEPLLLAKRTGCPVVIAPKRVEAVRYLLEKHQSQLIISDDGLQHYAMGRALEIVVIDGVRGLGNGLCLPAGPLREGRCRLKEADFVVVNGGSWPKAYRMDLQPSGFMKLMDHQPIDWRALPNPVAAVAGIGHPQRFFSTLTCMGLSFNPYVFPDHHRFLASDLHFIEKTVVMTEKDAVKCRTFATDEMYFLSVDAHMDEVFWDAFYSHRQLKKVF